MKINQNLGGFTLIELLVVVLIIGILASVALPQYQIAVEKSRAAKIWPILKTINDAEKAKNLEKDTDRIVYDLPELDLGFENIQQNCGGSSPFCTYFSTPDFNIGTSYEGRGETCINAGQCYHEPALAQRINSQHTYILSIKDGKKMCSSFWNSNVDNSEICKKIVGKTSSTACITGEHCFTE